MTGLRPNISATLGKTKDAVAQPIKRLDPMKPTFALDSHARSSCSYQLWRDKLLLQSTLWKNPVLPQKYGVVGICSFF